MIENSPFWKSEHTKGQLPANESGLMAYKIVVNHFDLRPTVTHTAGKSGDKWIIPESIVQLIIDKLIKTTHFYIKA